MSHQKWIKNLLALSMAMVMLALLYFTLDGGRATQAQGETAYVGLVRVLEDDELLPGDDKLIESLEKPAETLDPNTVAGVDLEQLGVKQPQGLAVDPASGHLHVFSLASQKLYELSPAGQIVAIRDLSEFGLASLQSMVFAPSGDQTDDPAQMNLYVTDGEHVVELSFVQVMPLAPAGFTSTLVRTFSTTDTNWSPYSSPDPSAIVYLPDSGNLLIADSEINEMSIPTNSVEFMGVNLFESSLDGTLVSTATTLLTTTGEFADEPTGITLDSVNDLLFISDDTGAATQAKRINVIDLGANGKYDWPDPDDSLDWFRTVPLGIVDAEGVTFASGLGTLFVVDGTNKEVYQISSGPDGLFFPTGDEIVIDSFDVTGLGSITPEGITYNPDNGTLYITGNPATTLFEVTTEGALVRTIDVSAIGSNKKPDGLAYAPPSGGTGPWNIYIAGAGLDNDFPPGNELENDGQVFEMTLPTNAPPVAVNDTYSTSENTPVTFDVTANDSDPVENPLVPASTNTDCHNVCTVPFTGTLANNADGTFVYTPTLDFSGPVTFTYQICDDEPACSTAAVTITVNAVNNPPVAVDDTASTNEDTPVTIDVATNDSDPNGNLDLTSTNTDCITCSEPISGTLANNLDGTFLYTPTLNFNGDDHFVYQICDTGAPILCDTAAVTITVQAVNDPPVAVDDDASTKVDTLVTIDVAANDSDPDGDLDPTTTNTACTGCFEPLNGSLDNNGDGTFDYTPNLGFTGGDNFVYEICDSSVPSLCDTATVDIVVGEIKIFIPIIIRN